MSKRRKPMSGDEKRETMMGIFYSSGEVFNMKELVKAGASAGVVENTVEEIVRGLLSDRMICDDKIGSGAFFWSFPSSQFLQSKARALALEGTLALERSAKEAAEKKKAELGADPVALEERVKKLEELAHLRAHRAALEAEIKAKVDFDPGHAAEILSKVKKCKAAADRWTDNLINLKSFLVSKYNMNPKEAAGMLGMGDDFDYPT